MTGTTHEPNTTTRGGARAAASRVVLAGTSLLLAAAAPSPTAVLRRPASPRRRRRRFGDFEVHYNAVRTDQLTPEVARAYGIERSGNRVLLNVSLLAKDADGRTTPVDGEVKAAARNLNGQLKDLQMRRVQEGSSIYFIGEVGISGDEILVFDIDATPARAANAVPCSSSANSTRTESLRH